MIRHINAEFVPVALKAGIVHNPPEDEEGLLYREIGRSNIQPQGICVINSAGKVLNWVSRFDDDASVLAFLDHTLERFAQYPGAGQLVAAERYLKFPSTKLEDVADSGRTLPVLDRHAVGTNCPAHPPIPAGTIVARVVGRAYDSTGRPVADTVRQEHYVEDRFEVPVAMQEALAKSVAELGTKSVRIADDFARLLVSHAYLGQLDVNPLDLPGDNQGKLRQCEFWAQSAASGESPRIRIQGRSDVTAPARDDNERDVRAWKHEVKLTWEGLIEMREHRISRLLLTARGFETLKWRIRGLKDETDVAHLVAGHPIDLASAVRYGIIGESLSSDATVPVAPP